jgi:hypothetical protein
MSNHTPEKWVAGRTDMRSYLGDGTPVHYVYRGEAETASTRIRIVPMPGRDIDPTDDALMIVACVNALRGLDVAKVEALLEACRRWASLTPDDGEPFHIFATDADDAMNDLCTSIRAGGGQ